MLSATCARHSSSNLQQFTQPRLDHVVGTAKQASGAKSTGENNAEITGRHKNRVEAVHQQHCIKQAVQLHPLVPAAW